jgi:hypothetical protein
VAQEHRDRDWKQNEVAGKRQHDCFAKASRRRNTEEKVGSGSGKLGKKAGSPKKTARYVSLCKAFDGYWNDAKNGCCDYRIHHMVLLNDGAIMARDWYILMRMILLLGQWNPFT